MAGETFEIELYHPSAIPGAGAQTESLGACKIISRVVFLTVTEHSGDAHLVPLADIVDFDRAQPKYTTTIGKTYYPRRVDLPDRIFVETTSGHARAVGGDQIARLVRSKADHSGGRVSW
jgi:hypothetical protein